MGNLYSRMKIFHFKDKLDSLPKDSNVIMPPLHIRLKPTNVCNHNCWYCAYRRDSIQLGKDMVKKDQIPYEKMMELIDDFAEMGIKAVTFSGGGDPLNYPFLAETLQRLSKAGIKFASLTNGSKLDGEIARIFAEKGTWLRISLDGWDSKSYASYRGVSEKEFDKVMENLKAFKGLGNFCYLGVVVIIDKNNANHVYEIIHRLRDIRVNSVKISPCIISNDSNENNNYHWPFFSLVSEQVKKARLEFSGKDFEIFDAYHEQLCTFEKSYTWCPFIQIKPVIGADLNVYSCQDKAYNIDEGFICSIKNQRFKDAWFSDKLKFFKINPMVICKHHCVVNEQNKMILDYLNADKEHMVFV